MNLPGSALLGLATPYSRAKGLAPWGPKPTGKYGQLLAAAMAVIERYRDHLPIGPRTIGYQLLPVWVPSAYPNKETLNKAVREVLAKARRAGLVPFDAIDDGRTEASEPWTIEDLPDVVEQVQVDRQAGQAYYVEVWVEARGNLSRVATLCRPRGIAVRSGSGSVPITATRHAAIRVVNRWRLVEQPSLFMVISDLDPNGVKNIQQALDGDVRAFIRDFGESDEILTLRQVALTVAQAETLNPASREPLSDRNRAETPDWPIGYKMEVEALTPDALDAIVIAALDAVHDPDVLTAAMAAEPEARLEALRDLLEEYEA